MANLKYFLWLTTRKGLSTGEAGALLSYFGTPEAAYFAPEEEYDLLGLPRGKKAALLDKKLEGAERILADCEGLGIHIMTLQDADYPERLAQLDDPPVVLYWKGKPIHVDDRPTVGVVGTRSCTPYGVDLASRLGLELSRRGVTLVSGMAQGIDAAGIRGALKGGGSVISVLGGGIDVIYPREHRWLYEDVAAAGTLVSEYPPGTEHAGRHFPVRNRILSGLSMGVAVVEAGLPSGALITARLALEQNREVFAFPGPVGAAASLGCNKLIQAGEAKLVLSAADILTEFSAMLPSREEPPEPLEEEEIQARLDFPATEGRRPRKERGGKEKEEKEVDKTPSRAYISLSDDPEAFTDDERDILLAIAQKAMTADEVSEATQLPARRVLSALTMLQLRELVEEQPGKRFYARVILTE